MCNDVPSLFTHLPIVKRQLEMSDASPTLVLVSELIPNLIPVVEADVLIIGQPAVPNYLGHEPPVRTMRMGHW